MYEEEEKKTNRSQMMRTLTAMRGIHQNCGDRIHELHTAIDRYWAIRRKCTDVDKDSNDEVYEAEQELRTIYYDLICESFEKQNGQTLEEYGKEYDARHADPMEAWQQDVDVWKCQHKGKEQQ